VVGVYCHQQGRLLISPPPPTLTLELHSFTIIASRQATAICKFCILTFAILLPIGLALLGVAYGHIGITSVIAFKLRFHAHRPASAQYTGMYADAVAAFLFWHSRNRGVRLSHGQNSATVPQPRSDAR
jgi:hypothetical protein